MKKNPWLLFAAITTLFWGIWGALIEIPEKAGFPATLGYVVWALTMLPCSIIALGIAGWKMEFKPVSAFMGIMAGLLGAGGQLILFIALRDGPAYIVFPLISLFPILTIGLSMLFLKERAGKKHWTGIIIALLAILLLSYQPASGHYSGNYLWLILSVIVFVLWGMQAFLMKYANESMQAEAIFFYMMLAGLLLIPFALWMTDFSKAINWGFKGPWLATAIHVLNAIGALTLVYALRYGKAMIVVPMTGLSPLITIVLSLILYGIVPGTVLIIGMALALLAIYLLSE
jgi:drug/metabolite transporter (DMT)-like permease